jgi:hypothetical protein
VIWWREGVSREGSCVTVEGIYMKHFILPLASAICHYYHVHPWTHYVPPLELLEMVDLRQQLSPIICIPFTQGNEAFFDMISDKVGQ